MATLNVRFCGVDFINPFVLSSAPPTATAEMIGRAFEAGWAGAVTKTMTMEGVEVRNVTPRLWSFAFEGFEGEPKKLFGLTNIELVSDRPLPVWEGEIAGLRQRYPDRVVIGSIMAEGDAKEHWQELARRVQAAGAQMLELNFSCPHGGMPGSAVGAAIGQDPIYSGRIMGWVNEVAQVPVLVKLTPAVADIVAIGRAVKDQGAAGLTVTNTLPTLAGVNLNTFEPLPTVQGMGAYGGMSGPAIKPLALRLVSELSLHVGLPISGVGGISNWQDAAEFILLGSNTVQVCTSVMFNGYGVVEDMADGLLSFLEDHDMESLSQLRGQALKKIISLNDLSRTYKVVSSIDTSRCVKCDICFVACRDGGYQAISVDKDRVPHVDQDRCTGCGLCVQSCPVWECVTMEVVAGADASVPA